MTFLHPWLLWLLLLPAALFLAAIRPRTRAASSAYPKVPRALVAAGRWSPLDSRTRILPRPLAACLALACLVLALARPQGATVPVPTLIQARDVLVAVDVSKSMLAQDIAPSRLERARLLIRSLADALRGERLGLLPFAGTAFLQSPLSADYEIFRSYLDELGPDLIPAGGSDYAALLRTAEEAFGLDGDEQAADRYLVVLGDGEAQDQAWRPLAEKLAARGVRVIALGLGTADGAMIPDGQGGFAKDNRGAVVLSRLQADTLRQLAELSGGTYRDASAWLDLPALLAETVERGRAGRVVEQRSERRQELFAWFLAPAFLLLFVSLGREFPADPVRRKTTRLTPRPIVASAGLAAALLLQPPAPAPAAPATPEPADPLVALVANLAAAQSPSPGEWAALANLTAELGEAARAQPGNSAAVPESAIHDALLAVEQGRRSGPGHADWDALRDRLARLLEKPDAPPQSSPQKSESSKDQPDSESSPSDSSPSSESSGQKGDNTQPDASENRSSSSAKNDSSASDSSQPGDQSSSDPASSSASQPSTEPGNNRPTGEQLGELGDGRPPEKDPAAPTPAPGTEEPPPPEDTPAQTVGGVSASGREDPPSGDPASATSADANALAVGQRLEQVRSADSPARLFQLMQDANAPRETPRPTQPKQDW